MRVLRRITGCISGVNTDGGDKPDQSNRAVRQMLEEPSIDCTAARARLKYCRRVVAAGPSMLRALVWNRGKQTEWALQVRQDLESLNRQVTVHDTVDELCCTARGSADAQWDAIVRELFSDSSCMPTRSRRAPSLAINALVRVVRCDSSRR